MSKIYFGFSNYDEFTNYVMNKISIKQRREIRKNWNNSKNDISWQRYLLNEVNNIKH